MSFIVVNTGRAASRAMHLNLKLQPGLVTCSRHQFDAIATRFIRFRDPTALCPLLRAQELMAAAASEPPPFGIVFHGARPRLNFPFENSRNRSFLLALREQLGIDTAFLVLRDPEEAFLSEINRRVARRLGNWAFRNRKFHQPWFLSAAGPLDFEDKKPLTAISESGPDRRMLRKLALGALTRTGKTHSMYRLFASVFPKIYFIPYESFLHEPQRIFDRMSKLADFPFERRSLVGVKLNALANRLLCYNPIKLFLAGGHRGNIRFLANHAPWLFSLKSVRLRFEIADALESCEDWGTYESLGYDCSAALPGPHADLRVPLTAGVDTRGFSALSSIQRNLLRNDDFIEGLLHAIAPVFDENYREARELYAKHSLRELPEFERKAFWKENGQDCERMDRILHENSEWML